MVDFDLQRFGEFTQKIRDLEQTNTTVSLEVLRQVFMQVFAHRPGISVRRDWMLGALHAAQAAGVIRLPAPNGKQWDSGNPRLPTRVTRLPPTTVTRDPWWKEYYWHPKLEWVADLRDLSAEDEKFLVKVQLGFVEHWFDTLTGIKYRSIQLTGNEKKLSTLFERKTLFGAGKLEIKDLNTGSDILPLTYKVVGRQPRALVFENKDAYHVALTVLRTLGMAQSPYGVIAFGFGGSFVDSVRDFQNIQKETDLWLECIEYVGDLDWKGISIAVSARLKAQKHGLPPVIPARGIHATMLSALLHSSINAPNGYPGNQTRAVPTDIQWLSEDVQPVVERIFALGNRVAEEMLTGDALFALWNEGNFASR